ncbi:hypothetical protein GCM10010376_15790 [Streptomyces violaceusniger]
MSGGSSGPRHTALPPCDSLVLALLGGAGWFAVRAGLRPLRRVETTAAAIADGDLSSRVPELAASRTEPGRLARALNGMLDRVEESDAARAAAAERMRRFIADASHELRTPLFGIKGFTELYRMGGMPERADVDAALGRIEREAARLVRLVEDLLLLARLDEYAAAADPPLHLTPMDLRTPTVDALHDLRALDPRRPVTLTGPGGGPPGGHAGARRRGETAPGDLQPRRQRGGAHPARHPGPDRRRHAGRSGGAGVARRGPGDVRGAGRPRLRPLLPRG